ncbi:hypothetical protein [Streptomyces sp. NBC_01481]|uniref:hypothetical protein n=1 Tax=Streptomyces sp. NBC_01481 TaxID=2975869 RepID=UPI00225251D8|nr:hypothetical protein [Streptomyces sp. NBC_01481]MCX4586188.1 hypothetical protein [Streptomyces sp. NBC_01481]
MADKLFEHKDASGKVTIAVFREQAPAPSAHFFELPVSVPDDMVVVGGGAIGAETPQGALLTASFPHNDRSRWLVSSKDHDVPNPHRLQGFAIGLKINGLSRGDLLSHLRYQQADSSEGAHPDLGISVPNGFTLISGGFRVNWPPGAGNLATASFPEIGPRWRARSKDHKVSSPCTITTFAIGLRTNLPGIGRVERGEASNGSSETAHPSVDTQLSGDFALTGIGAEARANGAGQLLWRLEPINQGTRASSKDHEISSPGTIRAFALGIKIV